MNKEMLKILYNSILLIIVIFFLVFSIQSQNPQLSPGEENPAFASSISKIVMFIVIVVAAIIAYYLIRSITKIKGT